MVNMSWTKKETASNSSQETIDSSTTSMLGCQMIPWFHHVTTIKIDYGVIHMLECHEKNESSSALPPDQQQSVMKMEPSPALRGEQEEFVDIGGFIMKVHFSAQTTVISALSTEQQEEQLKIYTLAIYVGELEDSTSFKIGRKQGFRLVKKDNLGHKRVLFIQLPPPMSVHEHGIVQHDPADKNKIVYIHILFPPEYFSKWLE